ncbi:MAG: hypothetical protein M1282_08060 [Chloroflexi bacterium]|nr:hypothetical protein [Chloroflexota bacterium]
MLKMLFVASSVLTLLLGAVGVTVAAAQNSQAGEPLYALKAWGEPFQFMFQAREQVQTQAMNGSAQFAPGQQMQSQIRMQTQGMFQSQQMNGQAAPGAGQQNQDQLQMQTQTRLQTCQTLDPSVTTLGDQVCDQTQDRDRLHDQDQLQTQDRLHTEDCVPDPQGSAAQNQNGGPHKP